MIAREVSDAENETALPAGLPHRGGAADPIRPQAGLDPGVEQPMTDLLTVQDLADLTHSSPDAIYQWRTRRQGPRAIKVGKRLLFRRTDVERWLETKAESDINDDRQRSQLAVVEESRGSGRPRTA